MMAAARSHFRTLSFADLDGGVWGAGLDGGARFITLGAAAGAGSLVGPESVDWSEDGTQWRLAGDGFELVITPVEAAPAEGLQAVDARSGGMTKTGCHQLCHVHGRYTLGGVEYTVDCAGARTEGDRGGELRSFDSVRSLSALFTGHQGLTLLACRPRGATGHEHDQLTAAVCENGSCLAVTDPRLSTTYTSDGLPARVSLEFWLGEGDGQYLRRAAGQALAPVATVHANGLEAVLAPFRWRSKGLEGRGVYLLARAR
jgi:hypothetical protein